MGHNVFLYKPKQLYCVLRLLCMALVVDESNQDPYKSGTLMLGTLNPWTLEPWNPRTLVIYNFGTLEHCGILEPCKTLEPCPIKVWNRATSEPWILVGIESTTSNLGVFENGLYILCFWGFRQEVLLINHEISGFVLLSDKPTWPPSACSREFPQDWMVIRVWCAFFFLSFFYIVAISGW